MRWYHGVIGGLVLTIVGILALEGVLINYMNEQHAIIVANDKGLDAEDKVKCFYVGVEAGGLYQKDKAEGVVPLLMGRVLAKSHLYPLVKSMCGITEDDWDQVWHNEG